MGVFSYASETHRAAILAQVPMEDCRKQCQLRNMSHSVFCLQCSTIFSLDWSVPEKGGFAIVEGTCRLDSLVAGRTVFMFAGHANLIYLFGPHEQNT